MNLPSLTLSSRTTSKLAFRIWKISFRSTGKFRNESGDKQGQISDDHHFVTTRILIYSLSWRLIIDRFILPLLSASKCCLRGGAELERGIEARRSILGQIRASIGIIMAVIKLSIFEPEQHFIFHQQRDISSPSNMDEINSMSNFTTQTPQFEPHYLPLEGFDDGVMISNDGGSPIEPVTSNENRQSSLAQNTTNDEPAHERSANLFRVTSASVLGRRQHQNQSTPNANPMPRLNRFQRTLKWDQQIMNYFLLNANASLSVHDAIDRLQVSCFLILQ